MMMVSMRLDKFLKVSRLIKRRTLAKEIADQGRITVNGIQAKASSNVKDGDELTVRFGQRVMRVKIESFGNNQKKEQANEMYTVISEGKNSSRIPNRAQSVLILVLFSP